MPICLARCNSGHDGHAKSPWKEELQMPKKKAAKKAAKKATKKAAKK